MDRMRIVGIEEQRHTGAIPRDAGRSRGSAANARHAWTARAGIVITVRIDDGGAVHGGRGEASPLPRYSADTLDDARRGLRGFARRLPFDLAVTDFAGLDSIATLTSTIRAPSARCAVETAVLDALGRAAGVPVWRLLRAFLGDAGMARPVGVSGLITDLDPRSVERGAQALVEDGIRVAKLKIGREGMFDRELAAAAIIRASGLGLRFDANQGLPPRELAARLESLSRFRPDLVEEPATPEAVERLASVNVPIGLDETLQSAAGERYIDRFAARNRLRAVVLKPMALGGPLRCLALARHARSRGATAVVSHLFDGPLAWAGAAHLALALSGPSPSVEASETGLPSGLDRHAGLAAWPDTGVRHLDEMLVQSRIVPDESPGLGGVSDSPW